MTTKFKLGQSVQYAPGKLQTAAPSGAFTITLSLPSTRWDHQYRIRNASEPYERIAQESQLTQA